MYSVRFTTGIRYITSSAERQNEHNERSKAERATSNASARGHTWYFLADKSFLLQLRCVLPHSKRYRNYHSLNKPTRNLKICDYPTITHPSTILA